MNIIHSLLPKLAECPCYESKKGEAGPAAQRGTLLDGRFREALSTGELNEVDLSKDDIKAVKWAVKQVKKIAGGNPIITEENLLKVKTPGIDHIGTEDECLCLGQHGSKLLRGMDLLPYLLRSKRDR